MAVVTLGAGGLEYPSDRYADIRLALGMTAADTTALPESVITAGLHLPWVLNRALELATDCITDAVDDDVQAEQLTVALAQWAAARIAAGWLANRDQSDRITSEGIDTLKVAYDKPLSQAEWQEAARRLLGEALDALTIVCPGALVPAVLPTMARMAGPSRAVALGRRTWREYLDFDRELIPIALRYPGQSRP